MQLSKTEKIIYPRKAIEFFELLQSGVEGSFSCEEKQCEPGTCVVFEQDHIWDGHHYHYTCQNCGKMIEDTDIKKEVGVWITKTKISASWEDTTMTIIDLKNEMIQVKGILLSFNEYVKQGMPNCPQSTGREPILPMCPKCGGHKFWCFVYDRENGWCGDQCGWHGTRKEWNDFNENNK